MRTTGAKQSEHAQEKAVPALGNGIPEEGAGPPREGAGSPAEAAGYGLNFETDDVWFYEWMRTLSERERLLMVFDFTNDHKPQEIEHFTLLAMPESFIQAYEEKRSYTVKEAFRRAVRKLFGETRTIDSFPLIDTVVSYIKASGSFRLDDLPDILGRTPNPHEIEQVRVYLASLSNDDLKILLDPHTNTNRTGTSNNTE